VLYSDAKVANRDVRDFGWEIAHAAVTTRWYPVPRATRTTLGFGICPSFKGHFLSRRAKPESFDSQLWHRCKAPARTLEVSPQQQVGDGQLLPHQRGPQRQVRVHVRARGGEAGPRSQRRQEVQPLVHLRQRVEPQGQRACPHAQLGIRRRLTRRLWNTASCLTAAPLTHTPAWRPAGRRRTTPVPPRAPGSAPPSPRPPAPSCPAVPQRPPSAGGDELTPLFRGARLIPSNTRVVLSRGRHVRRAGLGGVLLRWPFSVAPCQTLIVRLCSSSTHSCLG
jgi:hypothetical protein